MRIELEGTTFCVAGRFKNEARKARIRADIEAGGGRVLKSMGQSVEVLVFGTGYYVELEQAKERGLPILLARQLKALLRDGYVEVDFEPPHAPDGARPLDDLFGNVRSLLSRGASHDAWEMLEVYLEQCDADHVGALADYIHDHTEHWPTRERMSCVAPHEWTRAMLRGEDSPAFRAVRRVDLHGADTRTRGVTNLLKCESLCHVSSMDLSTKAKLTKTALRTLAKSAHMPRLEELVLGQIEPSLAAELDAGHEAERLTTLGIGPPTGQHADVRGLVELFSTRTCARVARLTVHLTSPHNSTLHIALRALEGDSTLPAFTHLDLDFVRHTPYEDATHYFDTAAFNDVIPRTPRTARARVRTLTIRTHIGGERPCPPINTTLFPNLRELRLLDAGPRRAQSVDLSDFDHAFRADGIRVPSSLERVETNAPLGRGAFAKLIALRPDLEIVQDPSEHPFIP